MKSKPYIINIKNISGKDLNGIFLDLTNKHKENSSPFTLDELHNFTLGDKLRMSCGNNDISFRSFYENFSKEESVIISEIKIICSNNNQQNQEYVIVRIKDNSIQNTIITEETTDFILNNEIYLTTGYFFKDAIITLLFYPK
jgi:hypothetical protein